ncbi:MAG TPA: ABC transporter substrate-binding protein [Rhodocyclaceae bacterium]
MTSPATNDNEDRPPAGHAAGWRMRGLALAAGALVAAAAIWWGLHRQESEVRSYRVALITVTSVDSRVEAGIKAGLADLGYREGDNLVFDAPPPVGQIDRLDAALAAAISRHPDLLMVATTAGTRAAKRATAESRLPVVFVEVNDPVASGIVASLKAPGGNITGVRMPASEKLRLGYLKELRPATRRVLVPTTPGDPMNSMGPVREAAARLGLALDEHPIGDRKALEGLLAEQPGGIDAIYLPRDTNIQLMAPQFIAAANRHRLPLSISIVDEVGDGALYSYGFEAGEMGRQAARLVDLILRGAAPGDLPVETGESYLFLNLKAAATIGLAVPPHVLKQATVILR